MDVESAVVRVEAHTGTAVLAWRDLTVRAKRLKRDLLKNVSGQLYGGICAVMGPSGSGKSTLLNCLAVRLDPAMEVTGEIRLNGRTYSGGDLKLVAGYVMQDDLLNDTLTVEETLQYTAKLRCPPDFTSEQRQAQVDKALSQVGLTHTRNTLVGSPLRKGISGGERKRLCVALELITEPKLLFLDEPTSGLDSVTALSLVETLRDLAHSGSCTIMCTIHQPQSKIYSLFDDLILLQAGEIMYQGSARGAIDHFAKIGFPVPEYTNPADHFMDVITPPTMKKGVASASNCSLLELDRTTAIKASYVPAEVDLNYGQDRPLPLRKVVPWTRQFEVLLKRSFMEHTRRRGMWLTQLAQSLVMAVLIGCVFLQIGTTQSSTVRRQPLLFFCVINQGIFGSMVVINSFPSERVLVLRERAAGTYYASAYVLAKMLAETSTQIITPMLFSCIVYWLVGLQPVASKFFIFMAFMVLSNLAAVSLALAVSAWCKTTDMSVTVLPFLFELARLFGGFFLSPANLPQYFSFLDAISFVKYAYVGISLNELQGLQLSCLPNELRNGVCPITSGEQIIDVLGLDYISIGACAGVLIGYVVFCRVLAYLGIRFNKW